MLALAPAMVRPERIAGGDDPDRTADLVFTYPVNRTSRNGVTGFPSRATREQGESLFRMMTDDLSALVRRALKEKPPLDPGYFSAIP